MYHPTRGGVRGGRDQFTWESVKSDKDRECYLGHSIMAPVGRWQEGKDITWYAKENMKENKKLKENSEFLKARELEEQALMAALGYRVIKKENINESKQKEDVKEEKKEYSEKKSKSSKTIDVKGAQMFEYDDKKAMDEILLKLLDKYGKDELIEALGGKDSLKSKKKKLKKKSKSKSHKRKESSSSESSDTESSKKRKISKEKNSRNKKPKKSKKSRKDSTSSSSSSSSSSESTQSDSD